MIKNELENYRLNRLAKRMQKGDEKAARKIYDELVNKVFGFCLNRLRNRETAEDITQEIFLKLVAKIKSFDLRRGNFTSWFWQLARNTLIDHYRSKNSKVEVFANYEDEQIEEMMIETISHESEVDKNTELRKIYGFLKTLPVEEQKIFELRFIADLAYKEISKITGKNESALRVRTSRLMEKIKNNFTE